MALGTVLGDADPSGRKCFLGSVKSNMGHLEPAAGIAGLMKAALSLQHGKIPPSLHFNAPNPKIPFNQLGLRVPRAVELWPENGSGKSRACKAGSLTQSAYSPRRRHVRLHAFKSSLPG